MSNAIKLGPAVLTSKDGKSRLEGEIVRFVGTFIEFRVSGSEHINDFSTSEWNLEYPDPPLPTLPHAVVQAGDKSRAWSYTGVTGTPWAYYLKSIDACKLNSDDDLLSYCSEHGGFEVLFNGIEPKGERETEDLGAMGIG